MRFHPAFVSLTKLLRSHETIRSVHPTPSHVLSHACPAAPTRTPAPASHTVFFRTLRSHAPLYGCPRLLTQPTIYLFLSIGASGHLSLSPDGDPSPRGGQRPARLSTAPPPRVKGRGGHQGRRGMKIITWSVCTVVRVLSRVYQGHGPRLPAYKHPTTCRHHVVCYGAK